MFRNFLTTQFADSFVRDCSCTELPLPPRSELLRCAHAMFSHWIRSQQTTDPTERSKALFVALTYLRDCRTILEENECWTFEIRCRYEVLEGRLADLFEKTAGEEGGQLRMLG